MSIEDPRLSSIDNTSAADEFDSAVEQHLGFVSEAEGGIEVAQAETSEAGRTDRLPAQAPVQAVSAGIPTEVTPDERNFVTLPAGIELDNLEFEVNGENLVLILADGTEIVVLGGAANIPNFVIGDLELPQAALFAALEGSNINVAAGPDGTFTAQGAPDASRNLVDNQIDASPEDFALAALLEDTSFGDEQQTGNVLGADGDTRPTFSLLFTRSGGVDEDYLLDGNQNDGVNGGSSISGSLGINWGSDDANVLGNTGLDAQKDRGVGFTQETLDALASQALTSDGVSLVYALSENGTILTAYKDNGASGLGERVFVASVSDAENGSYTFQLIGNLDHQAGLSENNTTIQFPFTAQDSDGSKASSTFSIIVNDDSPVIGTPENESVNEDDLTGKSEAPLFAKAVSEGNSAEGSLAIRWGADNDLKSETLGENGQPNGDDPIGRTVSFTGLNPSSKTEEITKAIPALAGLSSDGFPLSYRIEHTVGDDGKWNGGYQLIAFKSFFDGQPQVALLMADEREPGSDLPLPVEDETIFVITLDPTSTNGSYTFELKGNLDHYETGGDDSNKPETGDFLDLEIPFTATDSDGDSADGSFTVRIEDDRPMAMGSETGTVAENDLANFNPFYPLIFDFWQGSNGTSPYDGTSSDNSNTGLLGTVPVWGTLADNIVGGADDRGSFNLVTKAEAEEILKTLGPGDGYLTSKGDAINDARMITIDGVGDAIGFFASDGRLVFGLLVAENGTYNFRLFDQVDHPMGDNADTDAPEAVADTIAIDLSALVTFTDFDGDKIDLGKDLFVISITDDIPAVVGNLEVTLNEGDLSNFLSPVNLLLVALGAPVVGSNGNEQDPDGLLDGLFGTTSASGFLNRLFGDKVVAGGADEAGKFELVTEARAEALLASAGWRSNGSPIVDARIVTIEGLGQAMGLFTQDGRMVISLALGNGPLGAYDIRVWDQLDHASQNNPATQAVETAFEDTLLLNLGQFINYTDADGDKIDLDGHVTLKVVDDIPVVVGNLLLTLNEGDLKNFLAPVNVLLLALGAPVVGSNGNEQDPDGLLDKLFGTTSASGFLNELFGDKIVSAGADEIGRFGLVTEAQAEALLLAAGWSSKGSEIADARIITIPGVGQAMGLFTGDGRMVVSLTLGNGPLGAYDIRIWDQLDHRVGDDRTTAAPEAVEDTLALNLGQFITYTDADGDKIGLDGHVTLNVIDDIPVLRVPLTLELDEADLGKFSILDDKVSMLLQALGLGSQGTQQDPTGFADKLLGTTSTQGTLNEVFGNRDVVDSGTDEHGRFGLISAAQAEALLKNTDGKFIWESKDKPIDTVKMVAIDGVGQAMGFFTSDGRLVFTLALSNGPFGAYDVRVWDQLDHSGHDNPATGTVTETAFADTLALDLGQFITYTDADGDKVSLGGHVTLNIIDDIPALSGRPVTVTLEEEHSSSGIFDQLGQALGIDLSLLSAFTGDMGHGNDDTAGQGDLDQNGQLAKTTNYATGSLHDLIKGGADENGSFSFRDIGGTKVLRSDGSELTSKSSQVYYHVLNVGGLPVLLGYVNSSGGSAAYNILDRVVFSLVLTNIDPQNINLSDLVDGSLNDNFIFTQYDQFDSTLQQPGAVEDVLSIDLSGTLSYTDADGDKINLAPNTFVIKSIDDIPMQIIGRGVVGVVEEEHLWGGNEDTTSAVNPDLDADTNTPIIGALYTTNVSTGSLASLVSVGADEVTTSVLRGPQGKFSFGDLTGLPNLTSKDAPILYKLEPGTSVDKLIGYVMVGNVEHKIFTLELVTQLHIDGGLRYPGDYKFTLNGQIDHPVGGAPGVEDVLPIDFSSAINFSDYDGDTITLTGGSFVIKVIDDIPTARNQTASMTENQNRDISLIEGTSFSFGADSKGGSVSIGTVSLSNGPSGVTLGTPSVTFNPDTKKISIVPGTAFDALAAGQKVVLHIPYTVTDADGDSVTKDIAVTVTGTNDAPVIDLDTTATGSGVAINAVEQLPYQFAWSADLSDADSSTLSSMRLTLGNVKDGSAEKLFLNPTALTAAAGLIVTNVAGVVTIAGTASIATYETILKNIVYINESDNPTSGADTDRTVTVVVNDGYDNSASQIAVIKVLPANDPPALSGTLTATVLEGGSHTLTFSELGYTDPDDVDSGVVFRVSDVIAGMVKNGGANATSFTAAELKAGLITFEHDGSEGPVASFKVEVEDGNEDGSAPVLQSFTLNVTPVNDGQALIEVSNLSQTTTAPKVGDVLQVSVGTDPDGGNGASVTYKWYRGATEISGATGTTYTLTAADAGAKITAKASYVDGQGHPEIVSSTETAVVVANNAAPTAVGETIITNSSTTIIPDWVLLLNDSDPNVGDTLSVTADPNSAQSSIWYVDDVVSDTGTTTTYTDKSSIINPLNPQGGSFQYVVSDGIGGTSASATTTLTRVFGSTIETGSGDSIAIGGDWNDMIKGGNGEDVLVGGAGSDTLNGGNAPDILYGGLGADRLIGGKGPDTFKFDAGDSGATSLFLGTIISAGSISGYDTVVDFKNIDKLDLPVTPIVAANTVGRVNGTEVVGSTGFISSVTVAYHSINNGVITFYSASSGGLIAINSNATLAAVAKYLQSNDLGEAGTTVAFKTNLMEGDADDTFIYQQIGDTPDPQRDMLIGLADVTITDLNTLVANGQVDPIILDLDKNGFALSSIADGVTFDINADGHKDKIAWTNDDGILAYDVDGNGLIDNGSEIFTPDFNGGKFASGVAALASLDSNGDGKIDSGDDASKDLKIWIDANNNGVSDEGELSSLTDHGVTSISLTTNQTGGEEDGQTIFAEGEFTFADGSTGNFLEVGFDTIFGSDYSEGLTLNGGMGEVVMTGSTGADTFVFDGTALDDLDVADVITDFSSEEGDVLDVTALLDSLLGEPADEATAASHLRATVDEHGNTTVSVQTDANDWKDVVVLQNHEAAIKVLFDDKHVTVTPHD